MEKVHLTLLNYNGKILQHFCSHFQVNKIFSLGNFIIKTIFFLLFSFPCFLATPTFCNSKKTSSKLLPEYSWKDGKLELSLVLDYRYCLGTIELQTIVPSSDPTSHHHHHHSSSSSSSPEHHFTGVELLPEGNVESLKMNISTFQEASSNLKSTGPGWELLSQIGSEQFLGSVLAVNSLDELDSGLATEFCRNPTAWKHFYQGKLFSFFFFLVFFFQMRKK